MRLPRWLRWLLNSRMRAHKCVGCGQVSAAYEWEPWQCDYCGKRAYYLADFMRK